MVPLSLGLSWTRIGHITGSGGRAHDMQLRGGSDLLPATHELGNDAQSISLGSENSAQVQKNGRSTLGRRIPRSVFQTASSEYDALPPGASNATKSWQALNPSAHYEFFSDQGCRKYIGEHFGNRTLAAFDDLVPGAFKADLFRLCKLYRDGGVYADVDSTAVASLERIIPPEADCVAATERKKIHSGIYQSFIACAPGQPFLRRAIEMVVRCAATHRE